MARPKRPGENEAPDGKDDSSKRARINAQELQPRANIESLTIRPTVPPIVPPFRPPFHGSIQGPIQPQNEIIRSYVHVGDDLPDIAVRLDNGQIINLFMNYSQEKIVIFVFPLDPDGRYRKHARFYAQNYLEFQKAGVRVFGLSEANTVFLTELKHRVGANFNFISDPNHILLAALGAMKTRSEVDRCHFVYNEGSNSMARYNIPIDKSSDEVLFFARGVGAVVLSPYDSEDDGVRGPDYAGGSSQEDYVYPTEAEVAALEQGTRERIARGASFNSDRSSSSREDSEESSDESDEEFKGEESDVVVQPDDDSDDDADDESDYVPPKRSVARNAKAEVETSEKQPRARAGSIDSIELRDSLVATIRDPPSSSPSGETLAVKLRAALEKDRAVQEFWNPSASSGSEEGQ